MKELIGRLWNLHPARRERIARVVEARKAGDSLRAIASRERVSEKQIRLDLKRATEEGLAATTPPSGVVGLDGRRRGARKPAPPVQANGSQVEIATPPVPSARPGMCPHCLPLGYPHCRECVLASDPGLEVGRDGVIYRLRPPAEQAIVGLPFLGRLAKPLEGALHLVEDDGPAAFPRFAAC